PLSQFVSNSGRQHFARQPGDDTVRVCLLIVFLCWTSKISAQDPFEIHIYEYEPLKRGQYSLEAHLNFETQGTPLREGALLPTERQTHLTIEPTFGLTRNTAI